jgi:hypothetical protein
LGYAALKPNLPLPASRAALAKASSVKSGNDNPRAL